MDGQIPKKSHAKWWVTAIAGLGSLGTGAAYYGPSLQKQFITRTEAVSIIEQAKAQDARLTKMEAKLDSIPGQIDSAKDEIITMIRLSNDHRREDLKESEHRVQRELDDKGKRIDALEAALFFRSKRINN